jgi:hypothetical protein
MANKTPLPPYTKKDKQAVCNAKCTVRTLIWGDFARERIEGSLFLSETQKEKH